MGLSINDATQSRCVKTGPRVVFSKKSYKYSHLFVLFKNINVQSASTKKHLGVYLDEKLNFNTHIREKNRNS